MGKRILKIKVIPNSKKNKIGEFTGEYKKIHITAPPIENKANKELIKFLSKTYKIKKSSIKIIKGEKNQYKVIEIKI